VNEGSAVAAEEGVLLVKTPGGAVSLELMLLREGVARAFLNESPRNLKLAGEHSARFSRELASAGYSRILVKDNRKNLLRRTLSREGWDVSRAVEPVTHRTCNIVSTYDIPMDDDLLDERGSRPDVTGTDHMVGICMDIGPRKAWAFYTDQNETARIVSEPERRQGMLVAANAEEMFEAADCLVRFLALARKSWAVFSMDLGRFVRRYDPITMFRMVNDRPVAYEHSAKPLSRENKKDAIKLLSEYYDESYLQTRLRLGRFASDKSFSIHLIDGGFVIVRLEGGAGLIYDIYVTPARQGEGLGSELMKCALTAMAGRVPSAYLHTSYPRAKTMYEKFGFKTTYSQLAIRLDEMVLTPPSKDGSHVR